MTFKKFKVINVSCVNRMQGDMNVMREDIAKLQTDVVEIKADMGIMKTNIVRIDINLTSGFDIVMRQLREIEAKIADGRK